MAAPIARADTIVLEPVELGTFMTTSPEGYLYNRSYLRTCYVPYPVRPWETEAVAEFDLSGIALDTIVSVTYTARMSKLGSARDLRFGAYKGTGNIADYPTERKVWHAEATSAQALAGVSADVTQGARAALDEYPRSRFVGIRTGVLSSFPTTLPTLPKDEWYRTGEFRPRLEVVTRSPYAAFAPLGSLQSRGFYSSARGLSADGSTVVGVTDSITGDRAFVWKASRGMFDIGAGAVGATGVSGNGLVVVGSTNPGGYRWIENGSGAWFGGDAVAGATSSDASAVVGSSLSGGLRTVFRWTTTTTESYPTYVGGRVVPAQAVAASANGAVFAGSTRPYPGAAVSTRAFVWNSSGGQFALPILPGGTGESEATGVSGDGRAVVGWSWGSRGPEAFRWTSAGIAGLGNLRNADGTLGNASRANAISPDGWIVVGAALRDGKNRAFVWDPNYGMRDLQDVLARYGAATVGWRLYDATGVTMRSDRTVAITGTAYDPLGRTQAFYATLPDFALNYD